HGRPCHTNDRGGTAATDYTQGRLKMQPSGHTRFYTTLTDATKYPECPDSQLFEKSCGNALKLAHHYQYYLTPFSDHLAFVLQDG
ncbi:hypothetical protein, partial [Sphingobium cupriresistens]|uniref:hypothetical protein n=1 Tax=Sphingobium cupriresistens TaxID=1132417 RepID=UPI001A92D1C0